MKNNNIQSIKGFKDILPSEVKYYRYIENIILNIIEQYAIKEISHYKEYSYVLINQNVQQTVNEIVDIINTNLIIEKNKKLTERKIKSLINI